MASDVGRSGQRDAPKELNLNTNELYFDFKVMEMMTHGGSTKLATHKEKHSFRQSSLSLPMSMANRFAFAKLRKISSGGRVMLLSMVCPLELPSS